MKSERLFNEIRNGNSAEVKSIIEDYDSENPGHFRVLTKAIRIADENGQRSIKNILINKKQSA